MKLPRSDYGFMVPSILFFVLAFISVPVVFWYLSTKTFDKNVKGVAVGMPADGKGLLIQVDSNGAVWDLNIYLCKTKDDCLSSLTSGKRWSSLAGGKAIGKLVSVDYNESWKDYEFVKIFVKPAFDEDKSVFTTVQEKSDTRAQVFNVESTANQVYIVASGDIASSVVGTLVFSDQ